MRDIRALIAQQCASWPLLRQARENFRSTVLTKTLRLSDTHVLVQHNPSRVRSTASAVDKKSVSQRPCFLCAENLYPEQKGLLFSKTWHIINNPFPVCPDHLVINYNRHTEQNITDALESMIRFVSEAQGCFDAFYNGPACGASAPDHLHYQACPAGTLPLVSCIGHLLSGRGRHAALNLLHSSTDSSVLGTGSVDGRGFFAARAQLPRQLLSDIGAAIEFLTNKTEPCSEPMVNVIISGAENQMLGIVLPRRKHRPACFFEEHSDKLLISPGAVDLAGMAILPRKADFDTITAARLEEIFNEVCHGPEIFAGLANSCRR